MNFQNTTNKFKVVLSVGDESGIGPEVILKALNSDEIPSNIEYILVGSRKNLQNTYTKLRNLGIETNYSYGNFLLVNFNKIKVNSKKVFLKLAKAGILVRKMDVYKIKNSLRITIGNNLENKKFLNILKKII